MVGQTLRTIFPLLCGAPGMATFKDGPTASAFIASVSIPDDVRLRSVRIIRDYSMFDRREAPQYFPEAARSSIRS
jgi:hypothetical protein